MGRVSGKVAVVTGAGKGLGEAFARLLVEEGANVFLTDIEPQAASVAESLGEAAAFMLQDVRFEDGWRKVIDAAEDRFGPVSVLVNNAGITSPKVDGEIEKISRESYDDVIEVNQVGVYLGMKIVLPSMRRAGGGSIINISSVSGLLGKEHTIALYRVEIRGSRNDQGCCGRIRQAQHQSELDPSWPDRHPDDLCARWQPAPGNPQNHGKPSGRPLRPATGNRSDGLAAGVG